MEAWEEGKWTISGWTLMERESFVAKFLRWNLSEMVDFDGYVGSFVAKF